MIKELILKQKKDLESLPSYAATHDLVIKRESKNPELESQLDEHLTPKQLGEKYEGTFPFDTQDNLDATMKILDKLQKTKVPVAIVPTINNALYIVSDTTQIVNWFNRDQLEYLENIIRWCYQI